MREITSSFETLWTFLSLSSIKARVLLVDGIQTMITIGQSPMHIGESYLLIVLLMQVVHRNIFTASPRCSCLSKLFKHKNINQSLSSFLETLTKCCLFKKWLYQDHLKKGIKAFIGFIASRSQLCTDLSSLNIIVFWWSNHTDNKNKHVLSDLEWLLWQYLPPMLADVAKHAAVKWAQLKLIVLRHISKGN